MESLFQPSQVNELTTNKHRKMWIPSWSHHWNPTNRDQTQHLTLRFFLQISLRMSRVMIIFIQEFVYWYHPIPNSYQPLFRHSKEYSHVRYRHPTVIRDSLQRDSLWGTWLTPINGNMNDLYHIPYLVLMYLLDCGSCFQQTQIWTTWHGFDMIFTNNYGY